MKDMKHFKNFCPIISNKDPDHSQKQARFFHKKKKKSSSAGRLTALFTNIRMMLPLMAICSAILYCLWSWYS